MTSHAKIRFAFAVFLFALPGLGTPKIEKPPAARNPTMENCDFYLEMEKSLHCSEQTNNGSTYLTLYGHKYCAQFRRMSVGWTGKPKEWVEQTGLCLQEMLADNSRRVTPCSQLEEFAFDGHPICYKQYGFCELDPKYRDQIMDEVSAIDIIEQPRRTLTQVINVAIKCGLAKNLEVLFEHILHGSRKFSEKDRIQVAKLFINAPKGSVRRSQYFNEIFPILGFGSADADVISFSQYYPAIATREREATGSSVFEIDACLAAKIDSKDQEKCERIKGLAVANGNKSWSWSKVRPQFSMPQVRKALQIQEKYR